MAMKTAEAIEICERDNTIATLRQEIRLMHEDARAKEARIAELERELMAISQDDGKVERALERANDRIAELEEATEIAVRINNDHQRRIEALEKTLRNLLAFVDEIDTSSGEDVRSAAYLEAKKALTS